MKEKKKVVKFRDTVTWIWNTNDGLESFYSYIQIIFIWIPFVFFLSLDKRQHLVYKLVLWAKFSLWMLLPSAGSSSLLFSSLLFYGAIICTKRGYTTSTTTTTGGVDGSLTLTEKEWAHVCLYMYIRRYESPLYTLPSHCHYYSYSRWDSESGVQVYICSYWEYDAYDVDLEGRELA